ncbi:hypothetical protein [uncultured Sphingomonas sp.]|uniref:hypothetical protein n=1 Tax=uncultured Sphingomonas sp. TaxID=158754 RepID=UPI0025E08329|nr:hypothetical protein [uncultured Sphingomonas sp.]
MMNLLSRTSVLAAALFALSFPALAQSKKYEKKVEVAGSTYRVAVRDRVVTVSKKAFVVAFTMDERDRMREAATKVTGCRVYDEFPNGAKLKAKLDCSTPVPH